MENEFLQVKLEQIMTKDVIACGPNNTFVQVLSFFAERNINHIPVVDDNKLIGIISVKDIVRSLYAKSIYKSNFQIDLQKLNQELSISDIMTKNPITIDAEDTVETAKNILSKADFNCLLVTKDGSLAGIITTKDLIKLKIIKIEGSDYNPI